jgi:predicted nucleic acid-binding protein
MPTLVTDTGFLFSLYGDDAHTQRARKWLADSSSPISISVFNRYDFQNAVRFAAFRRLITKNEALASIDAFESDIKSGHLQFVVIDLSTVVAEASNISASYTVSGGHRSFDIIHVAFARVLKAATFLSFDENQRGLAKNVRIVVGP